MKPPFQKRFQSMPPLFHSCRSVCSYKRADGVELTATLYTPPGYNKDRDGPLPCLLWAYPREFKSKDAAGGHPEFLLAHM